MISTHQGSKIALSLCIARLPARFVEPEFARQFRAARSEWEQKHNRLEIADGLAYLKTPGHFLPSIEDRVKTTQHQQVSDRPAVADDDIHALLSSEGGLFESERKKRSDSAAVRMRKETEDTRRANTSTQWLIARYKSAPCLWTIPFTNRRGTDSAFSSLLRMCRTDIGANPHFSSLSPVAYRKMPSIESSDPSTKLFYYRAMYPPHLGEVKVPADSSIIEVEWVDRKELENRIPLAAWVSLRDALPLD
jgi:hypothetical protein